MLRRFALAAGSDDERRPRLRHDLHRHVECRLWRRIAPTGDHRRQHESGRRHHPVQHRGLGRPDDHAGERSAADHGGRHDRRLHAAGSIGQHASGRPGSRHRDPRRDFRRSDDGHGTGRPCFERDDPRTRDQPVLAVPDRRQLVVQPFEPEDRRLLHRLEPGWTVRLLRPRRRGRGERSEPGARREHSGRAQSDFAVDERHRDHHLRRRVRLRPRQSHRHRHFRRPADAGAGLPGDRHVRS